MLSQFRGHIGAAVAAGIVSDLAGIGQRVVSDLSQVVDGLSRTWTDTGGWHADRYLSLDEGALLPEEVGVVAGPCVDLLRLDGSSIAHAVQVAPIDLGGEVSSSHHPLRGAFEDLHHRALQRKLGVRVSPHSRGRGADAQES